MSHDQLMTILAPLISAFVLGVAGIATVLLTGIAARAKAYLDARGQAAASSVLLTASTMVQEGMANGAGHLALAVASGALDVTNLVAMRAEAKLQAAAVEARLPAAIALLQPLEGAVTEGILGKLGTVLAAAPIFPIPVPVIAPAP